MFPARTDRKPRGREHADGVPRAGQDGAVGQHKEADGLAQPGGGDGGHGGFEGGGARALGCRRPHWRGQKANFLFSATCVVVGSAEAAPG